MAPSKLHPQSVHSEDPVVLYDIKATGQIIPDKNSLQFSKSNHPGNVHA